MYSCPCCHPQGLLDTPSTFLDLLTLVVPSSFQAPSSLQVWPGSLVPLSLPVRTSFLASFLHCFCPAPRLLLLCWLHLAQLLHLELPGSQCTVLAPPLASEPMTPLTLSTHRLIAPSTLLWSIIPQALVFLWLRLDLLSL